MTQDVIIKPDGMATPSVSHSQLIKKHLQVLLQRRQLSSKKKLKNLPRLWRSEHRRGVREKTRAANTSHDNQSTYSQLKCVS